MIRELREAKPSEASTRQFFEFIYPWAYGFFRRKRFSEQDSQDLAQETVVRAFTELAQLRQPEQFRSWLFSIAANIFRNEARARARRRKEATEVSLDGADEESDSHFEATDGAILPDEELVEKQQRKRLCHALAKLPRQMRRCLALRLFQGKKYREIAAILQISIETVKAHLHQGKSRLNKELSNTHDQERPD